MASITLTITSLFNHYLLKNINFGDKIYDNAVICILSLFFSSFLLYINQFFTKESYNWIKFKFWYRHKDPLNFKTEWYKHDSREVICNSDIYFCMDIRKTDSINKYIKKKLSEINNTEIFSEKGASKLEFRGIGCKSIYNGSIFPFFYKGKNIVYVQDNSNMLYMSDISLMSKNVESIQHALGHCLSMIKSEENIVDSNIKIYEFEKSENSKSEKVSLSSYDPYKIIGNISPNKTIDKLFYEQKDDLMKLVERFKNGNVYPKNVGIDNKLGILLYGPPGTGKTGTILGLANYLQRNILIINFGKISKKKELDSILNAKNFSNYIFVFDEFDCILDVLTNKKDESKQYDEEKHTDWSKILAVSNEEERKEVLKIMKESLTKNTQDESIDLGYLLSKLDGLEDCTNRIIIATTNHPEKINPSLLRPGRFDIKLCLDNCTKNMYYDILKSYFSDINENTLKREVEKLKPKRWSPLEVYNKCIVYNDFYKTIDFLIK